MHVPDDCFVNKIIKHNNIMSKQSYFHHLLYDTLCSLCHTHWIIFVIFFFQTFTFVGSSPVRRKCTLLFRRIIQLLWSLSVSYGVWQWTVINFLNIAAPHFQLHMLIWISSRLRTSDALGAHCFGCFRVESGVELVPRVPWIFVCIIFCEMADLGGSRAASLPINIEK